MSTPALTMIQLQCFVRVVETGTFAEAGRQLGLSTSGISKTIARLEISRGVRLLNRSTHSLSLTPEGEHLIGLARDAVRSVEQVDQALAVAARDGTAGRVRLGAPTALLAACIAPLLPAFRAAHPDIVLDLRGSDEMVDLAEDGLDLVLRSGPIDGIPGHLQQTLFTFSWVTCASPAYLLGRTKLASPADLTDHQLIGFHNQRTGSLDPWRFKTAVESQSERWSPDPAIIVDDANAVAQAAIAGAGIAWTPQWLVANALRSGKLIPLLEAWSVERMTMSMVRRRHGNNPKRVDSVMEFLKANGPAFA